VPRKSREDIERQAAQTVEDLVARRDIYPIAEGSHRLGIHRTTAYRLAEQGRLEIIRIGRRAYITDHEVRRFVASAAAGNEIAGVG
jgi:excisionase family DNA binding protein